MYVNKTTSGRMLGMCYIICTSRGVNVPRVGVRGALPPSFFFPRKMCHIFFASENVSHILGGFSAHGFFADGFLFPVKKLGLLTNLVHWVRVLDAPGSYMYIVL
jgi:hypothetical protein